MDRNETITGFKCCVEFLCGECPYKIYYSHTYPLKCIHKLLEDLQNKKCVKEEQSNDIQ